ncbi:MAG: hypothetical protein CBC04_09180 [Verrucomicrobia bacterium TMED44]|nr:MAG: hypothetical protein CBC04_09180 [Verrucomicrobia bacterium TMED44]|tara:strand:+ start:255 stop:656 length:402 start_codon:yes stop_codon:yes gene_type:complete
MDIKENHSLKDLERLKRKIEKQIEAKKTTKEDQSALYDMIKKDHEIHRREDGRKVFRGVVDYLECYVNGLPPVAKSAFYEKFGIESKRGRVTPELIAEAKVFLSQGKTLADTANLVGVSTATCQKIKKGDYDS